MNNKTLALAGLILIAAISNANSMTCKNHMITEDMPIRVAIEYCGTPTQDTYSDVYYINKEGYDYHLHVNGAGAIDLIDCTVHTNN